jgi:hypothetical protein
MQVTGVPVVAEGGAAPADTGMIAGAIWAGPGYFDTMDIPLLHGRAFDERDRADTPRVAIVSERMARHYFGTANAVGRRFRPELDRTGWFEVIGVARDTGTASPQSDLVDPMPHLYYRTYTQSSVRPTTVVARTSLDAAALVGAMQRELRGLDATIPVLTAKTMERHLEDSLIVPKAVAALLGVLGALGLCLAGIGLYAVIAFAVSRRSREIGIRMALGARRQHVIWSVAREVAALVAIGTAIGLTLSILAILTLRAVAAPAPGISLYRPTADPVALVSIAAFMAMVGVAAALLPARRAVRMDPLAALRRH